MENNNKIGLGIMELETYLRELKEDIKKQIDRIEDYIKEQMVCKSSCGDKMRLLENASNDKIIALEKQVLAYQLTIQNTKDNFNTYSWIMGILVAVITIILGFKDFFISIIK